MAVDTAITAASTAIAAETGIPPNLIAKGLRFATTGGKKQKLVAGALAASGFCFIIFLVIALIASGGALAGLVTGFASNAGTTSASGNGIPAYALGAVQTAGDATGVPWPILAAVYEVTTDYGTKSPYSPAVYTISSSGEETPNIGGAPGEGIGPLLESVPEAQSEASDPQNQVPSIENIAQAAEKLLPSVASDPANNTSQQSMTDGSEYTQGSNAYNAWVTLVAQLPITVGPCQAMAGLATSVLSEAWQCPYATPSQKNLQPGNLPWSDLAASVMQTAITIVDGDFGSAGAGGATLPGAGGPGLYMLAFQEAAASCPGMPWTLLAGIGYTETTWGQSTLPGVHSGANSAGAEGPMQFEPATFAEYDQPVAADPAPNPPGGAEPPNPYDPIDAIWAAARMLCSDGAGSGMAGIQQAVFDYNHAEWYVNEVLCYADLDTASCSGGKKPVVVPGASIWPSDQAWEAAWYAAWAQGIPYQWGGDGPSSGQGFDCSGLVQAAYASAGVSLPRVAADQMAATTPIPASQLAPGDLVFFGSPGSVDHVGIYVGNDEMIDAPHTGADVRTDQFTPIVGTLWGSEQFLGATQVVPPAATPPAGPPAQYLYPQPSPFTNTAAYS